MMLHDSTHAQSLILFSVDVVGGSPLFRYSPHIPPNSMYGKPNECWMEVTVGQVWIFLDFKNVY